MVVFRVGDSDGYFDQIAGAQVEDVLLLTFGVGDEVGEAGAFLADDPPRVIVTSGLSMKPARDVRADSMASFTLSEHVYAPPGVSSFHTVWAVIAVWINGIVGLWGVALMRRARIPKTFYWAVGVAIAAMLVQVTVGVILMSTQESDPGNQHVFYGVLIAAVFAFSYIYRAQFRKRPALSYGLLLLFTTGLGIRGIMTFGVDFGCC